MEEVRNVAVPQPMSAEDIRREKGKLIFEDLVRKLRKNRKEYLQKKMKGKKVSTSATAFDAEELAGLKQLVSLRCYSQFKIQVCDVLVEGIKYPDKEIRDHCSLVFDEIQEYGIDPYLWKKILSANFIPKIAQAYIKKNRSKLESKTSIAYLLDGCDAKFSGAELGAADFQEKEAIKAEMEKLAQYVRLFRKQYRTEQNSFFAILDAQKIEKIKSFLNVDTYMEYPIQVADLVYEGCKSPDVRIEQLSLEFAEELLKLGKLDVYFWTKMLASDWVTDAMWVLLQKYPAIFVPQKEDLRLLITSKIRKGRSKTSDAIYDEVVDIYF